MQAITPVQSLDPFPWYAQMRATSPVFQDRQRGSWNVFRYDTVVRVLSDYETFSSQFGQGGGEDAGQPFAASLISTDPPRHRQLRNLVTQAFTPRAVEALAPRISAIVDELLDRVMAQGTLDVIKDFGDPLPVIVIAELLGVPSADRARFKAWSDAIVSTAAGGQMAHDYDSAGREMAGYFRGLIEQRRREPGADLISGLLRAEIDGQHLSMQELLGFGSLLLVAGNETTTNLLGNALLVLTEHPDVWARLRADRSLLVPAIEEVLRFRSPVQSMYRVSRRPTKLDGLAIPAGSFMVAWIGSANHDESQFADPERFVVDRRPNRHIAFGHGIHFCLGAPLARLEARLALNAMLDRFSLVARAGVTPLERLTSTIVYGLRHVPIRFEPA